MTEFEITSHEEVVNRYIGTQGTEKRDKFDAELKKSINKDKIDEAINSLNFERIHKAMVALNWKWSGAVPSVERLKEVATELLTDIAESSSGEKGLSNCGASMGGFHVEKQHGITTISFVISRTHVSNF